MIVNCVNYSKCGKRSDGSQKCFYCDETYDLCNNCYHNWFRPNCIRCGEVHVMCDKCFASFKCKNAYEFSESSKSYSKKTKTDSSDSKSGAVVIEPAKKEPNTLSKVSQQSLTLLHLDVDQGACTLVLYIAPDGERWTAVIDGGHGNPGRGQIVRYLNKMKIKQIDALILSHHDADHADGLADLIFYHYKMLGLATLYVPYESSSHAVTKYAKSQGVKIATPPSFIFNADGFQVRPLQWNQGSDENGRSLALLITLGKFKYLTCGDLPTDQGEDGIALKSGAVDVIYCSHHGSAHSTSEQLLKSLDYPPIAVISAGRNGYGHPNSETLERLVTMPKPNRFYLTGCQYNRKYVNPEYYDTELKNLTAAIKEGWEQYNLAPNIVKVKNLTAGLLDGVLFCLEEGFEVEKIKEIQNSLNTALQNIIDEKTEPNHKSVGEFFLKQSKDVTTFVQNCFKEKKKELPLFGVLSGTQKRMGPVGIRILPPPDNFYVDVGFCFEKNGIWQWLHRWGRNLENRLCPLESLNEYDFEVNDAIPEVTDLAKDSPGKFKDWRKIRTTERAAFSLSSRTPRQPVLVVEYKCRWCEKKGSKNMVLVECEFCRAKGFLVAYHQDCFKDALKGEQIKPPKRDWCGGEVHSLEKLINELLEQRESEDVPVLTPAKYEACYFCGIFRKLGRYYLYRPNASDVSAEVKLRREAANDELLGDVDTFAHDDTFEDFYKRQPQF